jgi:hypothetical protein
MGGIIILKKVILFHSIFLLFVLFYSLGSVVAADSGVGPSVKSSNPANNSANVPSNQLIKVNFNESVKQGSNFFVELKTSSGTNIAITKSLTDHVLTVRPKNTLAESRFILTLNEGCVKDLDNNPLKRTTINFSVGFSPTVTNWDPPSKAINIKPGSVIKVAFNKKIMMGNSFIELKTSNGTVVNIFKEVNGQVLTINHPIILDFNTRYTVYLHTGCVKDIAGNPIAPCSSYFTTHKQGVVPSIIIANTATMRSSNGKPLYKLPYELTNYGKSTVYNFQVKIYLTRGKSISGNKYFLAKQTISSLAPGKSIKLNTPYIIPGSVPLNSYYVAVVTDGSVEFSFIKTRIVPFNPDY